MPKASTIEELRSSIAAIESGSDARKPHAEPPMAARNAHGAGFGRAGAGGQADALEGSEAAFKKIIDLVNVSDRSEKAIRERLGKLGFDECAIDESVERAKSYAFIDDSRFANVLVRSRLAQGRGSAGIERELREHAIDPYTVDGWPHEFGVNDDYELDRALDLLDRKPPRSKNRREGAFRRLVQKGYPVDVASRAAREWCERLEHGLP